MKKSFILAFWVIVGMMNSLYAQTTNTVKYKVTYDAASQTYTAWVVPDYSVPNTNNAGTSEIGATAQYTLVVPKTFVIQNITDVKGTWEKAPDKLGQGLVLNGITQNYGPSVPSDVAFYVIGKSPDETNYGALVKDQAVALFTFKSNGCVGAVRVLPPNDNFITAASSTYSLNVANSFYSRSGQPAGGNVIPKEQFVNVAGGPALCNGSVIYAYDDNNITNQNTAVSGNVLTNDDGSNGTLPLVVTTTAVQQPAHGSVNLNANGTYTYTPANGYVGNDNFKYRVCDSSTPTVCDTATVTIQIKAVNNSANNPPIALGDNYATTQGQPIAKNVLLNDKDPDAGQTLTASVLQQPLHGTFSLNPDGTFLYTPSPSYVGDDFFLYRVCDNGNPVLCDTARVDLNIYPANFGPIPPTANTDLYFRTPTGTATGNLLTNDQDNSGTGLVATTTAVTNPSNGIVQINSDGTFVYTPNAGYTGGDSFVYQVCDNQNPKKCASATAFILVQNSVAGNTDIRITKTVDKKIAALGESVIYKVVVKNLGPTAATNINVRDDGDGNLIITDARASKGAIIAIEPGMMETGFDWSAIDLAAGDSAVLTLTAELKAEGVRFNNAKIVSLDQTDTNLANNEASVCTTVPLKLCAGEKAELSIPATYTNVKWFKNGGATAVATGNTVLVSDIGTYTFTATNGTCPTGECCPVIVEAGVSCCPKQLCVPVALVKKRK